MILPLDAEKDQGPVQVQVYLLAPLEKVWQAWTNPTQITQWYIAHEDWHTPFAENDLKPGGTFRFQMAEKSADGLTFDFSGTYTQIIPFAQIDYEISDGRKVTTWFRHQRGITHVKQQFEPETLHPVKFQKIGWQNILNNFKAFVENN